MAEQFERRRLPVAAMLDLAETATRIAEGDLTRLHLRKNHLELAMADPAIAANFVEMRRVTSELADIDVALAAAEDAWLSVEERAP